MYLRYNTNKREAISKSSVIADLNIDNEGFTSTSTTWNTLGKLYTKRWIILGSNTTLAITNVIDGQTGYLVVAQNPGGFSLSLPFNSYGNNSIDKRSGAITLLSYVYDGSNFLWDSITSPIDKALTDTLFDHYFHHGNIHTFLNTFSYNSSTANPTVNTSTNIGIVSFNTGTNVNGIYGNNYGGAVSPLVLGACSYTFRCIFRIPVLADVTNSFFIILGFSDVFRGVASTTDNTINGVYLYYDQTNTTFRYITKNNSVTTNTNSNLTVVANTFYSLTITINKLANSVNFSINNANSSTITTNIPSGATRPTSLNLSIAKSAGTVSRSLDLDYVQLTYDLT